MNNDLEKDIKTIIEQIDTLKDQYEFKDEDNEEEAWDALEAAVASLESFQEVHERDVEYVKMKDALGE